MPKKIKLFTFLLLSIMFFSCETTDDQTEITEISVNAIKATVTSGTWLVSLFQEDGNNQTSNFTGFDLTFNPDGILMAVNGTTSITGAWSISSDSSSNDDNDLVDDVDFNIFFTTPSDFAELSEDWDIISFSEIRIELKDISGGDGSIDRLILEKQ